MRLGNMYGPDATFVGVPAADLATRPARRRRRRHHRRPVRRRHLAPAGRRFGPQAIRFTDYLPHDGSRPHLALGVDPLAELRVADVGRRGDALGRHRAVAARAGGGRADHRPQRRRAGRSSGGDHTIAFPDATGWPAMWAGAGCR